MHRLVGAGFVLEHADGCAFVLASIKPIVAYKSLRLFDDWHELLAYTTVNLCAVLWIKMIMTNDGERDAAPLV